MNPTSGTPLPPRWGEMLASVEQALAAAVEAVARREQTLAAQVARTDPPPEISLGEGLARFRERLRRLGECAARAEQAVAQADADLAAGEESLRQWFQAAGATRRKLADRAAGP